MELVVQFIRKRNGNLKQDDDEIELDIEAVDAEILWELDWLVTNWKKVVSKIKRQALLGNLNNNGTPNNLCVFKCVLSKERGLPSYNLILGGFLSAYDLSGEEAFLEKSKEVAERLLLAWDTPSGIPYNRINLDYGRPTNPKWTRGSRILVDSGSEQLEFIALSHIADFVEESGSLFPVVADTESLKYVNDTSLCDMNILFSHGNVDMLENVELGEQNNS
ncbi:hypothetical protein PIB30_079824 [Stylosanthes scabra]|uniref:NET domain-containing protein n=1 Tax=Stylosanthes scabra TaxID=79078 RepID=A0ABU6WUM8_9FABA|nr:hypothetical protein [Stylosanthes scabra]